MSDRAKLEYVIAITLACVSIISVAGMLWLAVIGLEIPVALASASSAAVGALGGALSVAALSGRSSNGTHAKSPTNPPV